MEISYHQIPNFYFTVKNKNYIIKKILLQIQDF